MVVAGLLKNTLIDFPGRVSAVVFTTGCNFTCPYCHNPELARGQFPQRIPIEDVLDFLSTRRTLLDGVVITGGEPTLWPHLLPFCKSIKALDLAVKLDTNGTRPQVLREALGQGLVDYIAMDIKTSLENYGPPLCKKEYTSQLRESIEVIMTQAPDYEFRTTCATPFVNDEAVASIAREIENARRYILQPMGLKTLMDPSFFGDDHAPVTRAELERFRSIVLPLVPECSIRSTG